MSYDQIVLNAMASSVLVVDGELRLRFVNSAAEQLLGASRGVLVRRRLHELLPFDSPLFDLVRRVQEDGHSVSDYGVDLPFNRGAPRLVDLHVSPLPEMPDDTPGGAAPLLGRAPAQSPAGPSRRRARRRGPRARRWRTRSRTRCPGSAARRSCSRRSVAEDERPLIRLICEETDRICGLVDHMEQFADGKPIERGAVNIYLVLEHVRRLAESGFARHVRFTERYDPSLARTSTATATSWSRCS